VNDDWFTSESNAKGLIFQPDPRKDDRDRKKKVMPGFARKKIHVSTFDPKLLH